MRGTSQHSIFTTDIHSSTLARPSRQANILDALPSELLTSILSYLSAVSPSDIACCRLVNRNFKEYSSPFLLPRVVFARRLKVITKLHEVLQHPYFRLHVTELVYDGSSYAEATAMDLDLYLDDCERAPRDLEDAALVDRQRGDAVAWSKLSSFRYRNLILPGLVNGGMSIRSGTAVREVPQVNNSTRFNVFNSVMTPLHMPYLRSLSLRRWIFTAEELKPFLLAHATTLRDLHLLGCLCGDDEVTLARWGGQSLFLTGIELSGFLSVLDIHSANPHGWKCVHPAQWRQKRPTLTPGEVKVLERIWLAGRANGVERQQRREILPESEWWKQPAYR